MTDTADTATVLQGMFVEDTGTALCDSGGIPQYDAEGHYTGSTQGYGRHHERNKGRDFEGEPETTLEVYTYTHDGVTTARFEITHNAYHWLKERLDYDAEIDAEFNRFAELPENRDVHWLALMEEFPEWSAEQRGGEAHGIYGEGKALTVNTYNGEDLLSQTLQYTFWHDERGSFILLQVHGGTDVRGGYTKPRVFSVCDDDSSMFDNARATILCANDGMPEHNDGQETIDGSPPNERCHAMWYTDDAYNWYGDGSAGHTLDEYPVEEGTEAKRGTLVIDPETHGAFCPVCGRSKLTSTF